MGQRQTSNQLNENPEFKPQRNHNLTKVHKNLFEFQYVVGRGGFGKVWKVQLKKTSKTYAMKEMLKAKVIDKKSQKSIKYEKDLLSELKHP